MELTQEQLKELADDLLKMHNDEAISLDTWIPARRLVEHFHGIIEENGV